MVRVHVRPPSERSLDNNFPKDNNEALSMLTVPHVLIGGAVAVAVSHYTTNPIALIAVGAITHFIADAIPHLDVPPSHLGEDGELTHYSTRLYVQVAIDISLALLFVAILWYKRYGFPVITPFVYGAFGGFLPDLIDNVPFWNKPIRQLPVMKQFHAFHNQTHHLWRNYFPMKRWYVLGVVTQVAAIALSVTYLLKG